MGVMRDSQGLVVWNLRITVCLPASKDLSPADQVNYDMAANAWNHLDLRHAAKESVIHFLQDDGYLTASDGLLRPPTQLFDSLTGLASKPVRTTPRQQLQQLQSQVQVQAVRPQQHQPLQGQQQPPSPLLRRPNNHRRDSE
jgi:hypothetical protein